MTLPTKSLPVPRGIQGQRWPDGKKAGGGEGLAPGPQSWLGSCRRQKGPIQKPIQTPKRLEVRIIP